MAELYLLIVLMAMIGVFCLLTWAFLGILLASMLLNRLIQAIWSKRRRMTHENVDI